MSHLVSLILFQLAAYFFPIVFSVPLFGKYLAREWLWSFTPSLSYVGQGRGSLLDLRCFKYSLWLGIIMGFPTTLSMNLVICLFRIRKSRASNNICRECWLVGGFYRQSPSMQGGHQDQSATCPMVPEGGSSGFLLRSCLQIPLSLFSQSSNRLSPR